MRRVSICVRCPNCDREVKGPATCKADPAQRRIDDMVRLKLAELPSGCPLLKRPEPTDDELAAGMATVDCSGCKKRKRFLNRLVPGLGTAVEKILEPVARLLK